MMQRQNRLISFAIIAITGFVIYANSLSGEFIWDDELLIVNNRSIKEVQYVPNLFTKNITYGTAIESNLFRPLQMLTYALNYAGWKLDQRVYHLTNVVLHILVAIMLYKLAQLISGNQVLSLSAALLFITHPIHTEAVTYISGRAESLVALFTLASSILYMQFSVNRSKIAFYFLSLASFILALLCKEIAIVVPLLLIAYAYIYRGQKRLPFLFHLPFFLIGLVYILLRKTILNFSVGKTIIDRFSLFERIPVIFESLTLYFSKLLFPLNLHMEYEPIIPPMTDVRVILGAVIASLLIFLFFVYRKKEKLVSFSIAWFLINYLPVSNIYALNAFFAEHWIYMPSLGLFILAGLIVAKIWQRERIFKNLISVFIISLLICYSYLTMKQNRYWNNPEDFYKRTLRYAPRSPRLHFRLGLLYFRKGMLDQGIEQTKKALQIDPGYLLAYGNLVAGYLKKGLPDQAIAVGERGLQIGSDSDTLLNNLGIAYARGGRHEEALVCFKKALLLNPDNAQAHNSLGSTWAALGAEEEAVASFRKAIEINPDFAMAHYNLGRMYYEMERYDLAVFHRDRARKLGFDGESY